MRGNTLQRTGTVLALLLGGAGAAWAGDAVAPGRFVVEPPTLISLGFEWKIAGDDNRNATVTVEYRKKGEARWRAAQPLLRIGDEKVWRAKEHLEYVTPRMFAGSVLDLDEGVSYECRFTMRDPDGVRGNAVETAVVTTRTAPRAYTGGRTLHVYPPGYTGPRQEPSFFGLMAAYYGAGAGDWDVVWERKVHAGDVILVHAGLYKADRTIYDEPYSVPFTGTYTLTVKGTRAKPVVIRGAGDGEAIFDGAGNARLFDVMAADYNYFENLTIRNTDIAFFAGLKDVLGPSGLVVRDCRIEDVGIGLLAQYAGSKDFYIADNVLLGRDDRYRLIGWKHPVLYPRTPLKSYIGLKVYGRGHVIAHNYVAYFHDGIDVCTHGAPTSDADKATAIDIYNNDIFGVIDDFIEADGGAHNIRVMRNRGFNAAEDGVSVQPVFGGPAYFYRNVIYNVPMGDAIKYGAGNPAGIVFFHNTFIAEAADVYGNSNGIFRNNLFIGASQARPVLRMRTYTAYTSLDFDGYRPNPGDIPPFQWRGPAPGVMRDYGLEKAPWKAFAGLDDFRRATGQELHGVMVDYDVFRNVRAPDQGLYAIYPVGDMDFSLRPQSAAVDAGAVLPNINDGYAGRAPDLGALEVGSPAPVYGPRR